MNPLFKIKSLVIDFLFPKSERTLRLESLSTGKLLEILPTATNHKNGSIIALFDYNHPVVKEIVWELKYAGNIQIADKLGEIICDVLYQELDELGLYSANDWQKDKIILVPVPMSDKRRSERGWNQSEILSEKIAAHDREKRLKYIPRQLAKVRHTESQTKTSSKSERLKNLTDSMQVLNPSLFKGKSVVVIDDVTTTGSTFREAERALRVAGVNKILFIAVAH